MKVCLIAGNNPDYIFSLTQALAELNTQIELIGADAYENFDYGSSVVFFNLRGSQDIRASFSTKLLRIVTFYLRCIKHLWHSDAQLVHFQNFRFIFVEGIILVFVYKILGKKVVYTAHNVQKKGKRNRLKHALFQIIYRNVNHIICHTENIKGGIIARYSISADKISVIQRGLNSSVPATAMSRSAARKKLDISPSTRVLLMFGVIRPDKGYDVALQAVERLSMALDSVLLLIAGDIGTKDNEGYLESLKHWVIRERLDHVVRFYNYHIPDADVEVFFKAADALLLPYRDGDFQSGVLFLAYRFGIPIIASDVGSFAEEIARGMRGCIFQTENSEDLACKIEHFVQQLESHRDVSECIVQYGGKYSWRRTADATRALYGRLLER